MVSKAARGEIVHVRNPVVYHVAPNKNLNRWKIFREGRKPQVKGVSKEDALQVACDIARKNADAAIVLIHKTRYIIERRLEFSS